MEPSQLSIIFLDTYPRHLTIYNFVARDRMKGHAQLDKNGDLMVSISEIINVAGAHFRNIGYWSKQTGLSATSPENTALISDDQYHLKPKISDIICPGESKTMPRGWVYRKQLVIGVPIKTSYKEFITVNGSDQVDGFCIDVFITSVKLLPYIAWYTFKP